MEQRHDVAVEAQKLIDEYNARQSNADAPAPDTPTESEENNIDN